MKRRTFLQALAGVLGLGAAAPALAKPGPVLRPEFAAVEAGFDNLPALVQLVPEVVYMHWSGTEACGGIAYRMTHYPAPNAPVLSSQFRLLDGSPVPDPRAGPTCCSCGRRIGFRRSDIVVRAEGQGNG